MIMLNHYVTCFWYYLGYSRDDIATWLNRIDRDPFSIFDGYAVAYHWSLTQFIGCTDVEPVNTLERMFTIIVLLFAFLVLAIVPPRITTLMTKYDGAAAENTKAVQQLRD